MLVNLLCLLKNEFMMPKVFKFEVLNRKKFTRICLTYSFSFLLVTAGPLVLQQQGKYFTG